MFPYQVIKIRIESLTKTCFFANHAVEGGGVLEVA